MVITRYHREGNNRWETNWSATSSNSLYLKTAAVDKNPFDIALVDRYESCVCAWVSPFMCTDLLPTTEVNQQSLSGSLSFISALCSELRPHLEGILAECLFLDWLWGSDPYRCVCCAHVDQISGRAKTDWSHQIFL